MESHATAKGQIVIPASLRRKYGIKGGTKIKIYNDGEPIISAESHVVTICWRKCKAL
jgi:AbrB family looped-hinge helix DNA binding protein